MRGRTIGALCGVGLLAELFAATPAVADIGGSSSARASMMARIEPPASIGANQDFILGAIRLRVLMNEPSGVRVKRVAIIFATSTSQARASFIIAGEANEAISIEVPRAIILTATDGVDGAVVETRTVSQADENGVTPPPQSLDRRGLLAFGVIGKITAPDTSTGSYRGTMIAVAQYN